jgi:hypothetical protein
VHGSLDPDVAFPSFFIFIIIVFEWREGGRDGQGWMDEDGRIGAV